MKLWFKAGFPPFLQAKVFTKAMKKPAPGAKQRLLTKPILS